jgi:type VI secretion system protein ImpF
VKRYTPSLLDKLLDDRPEVATGPLGHSAEQVKDAVARDIECLLNSRRADHDGLDALPLVRQSLLTYGMVDISSLSLVSDKDRRTICESIAEAVRCHDSRLDNVQVDLRPSGALRNVPAFVIHALLRLEPHEEPVSFDAVLDAGSKAYRVSQTALRRPTGLPGTEHG